jgi:hypothetical protein
MRKRDVQKLFDRLLKQVKTAQLNQCEGLKMLSYANETNDQATYMLFEGNRITWTGSLPYAPEHPKELYLEAGRRTARAMLVLFRGAELITLQEYSELCSHMNEMNSRIRRLGKLAELRRLAAALNCDVIDKEKP